MPRKRRLHGFRQRHRHGILQLAMTQAARVARTMGTVSQSLSAGNLGCVRRSIILPLQTSLLADLSP